MPPTVYLIAADVVVVLHLFFVIFVVVGGLGGLWRPKVLWFHIPALFWGVLIEFSGWICPLTPLENFLRHKGGGAGYSGGFIEHLILPVLYPTGLTRTMQLFLGAAAIALNGIVYWAVARRHVSERHPPNNRGNS
jgi:hypothetical protein